MLLFTIIIIVISITIFVILLLLLMFSFVYLCFVVVIVVGGILCIFLVRGPIQPDGSPFSRFLTLGCCELKEKVSTRTYLYNHSIQPSLECLAINWMVNSRYGP